MAAGLPTMSLILSKSDLRQTALAARDGLDPEWRAQASHSLTNHAPELGIEPGQIVSGFWPIRSEIDPRPLMDALFLQGAVLCLPAVIDRTTIVFRRYAPGDPLTDGGFGTMAPAGDAPECDPHIMLVPLSAFDGRGNRIGYGAGHYDRAIARLTGSGMRPRLIGLGFECQRVDAVPAEPHDVPLDAMITETGLHPSVGTS